MPTLAQPGRRPVGLQPLATAPGSPRAGSDPPAGDAAYQRLAVEVVRQALRDAQQPEQRSGVVHSIQTGALSWWLEVAGVHDAANKAACAAILERTRGH